MSFKLFFQSLASVFLTVSLVGLLVWLTASWLSLTVNALPTAQASVVIDGRPTLHWGGQGKYTAQQRAKQVNS